MDNDRMHQLITVSLVALVAVSAIGVIGYNASKGDLKGQASAAYVRCSDNDPSNNIFYQGYVQLGTTVRQDACDPNNVQNVWDYYCKKVYVSDVIAVKDVEVSPTGRVVTPSYTYTIARITQTCPLGTECLDGACVNGTNQTNSTCFDSDGGRNYGVSGYVSGMYNSDNYQFEDFCVGSMLEEKYCSGNNWATESVHCESIGYDACNDGKCVNNTMNITDTTPPLVFAYIDTYNHNLYAGCNATDYESGIGNLTFQIYRYSTLTYSGGSNCNGEVNCGVSNYYVNVSSGNWSIACNGYNTLGMSGYGSASVWVP